jgi:hypothetical protein
LSAFGGGRVWHPHGFRAVNGGLPIRENPTKVAKRVNKTVVGQAREFVWGVDDSQLDFVQKHIGTIPERDIITPEQRQEALDAARGRP